MIVAGSRTVPEHGAVGSKEGPALVFGGVGIVEAGAHVGGDIVHSFPLELGHRGVGLFEQGAGLGPGEVGPHAVQLEGTGRVLDGGAGSGRTRGTRRRGRGEEGVKGPGRDTRNARWGGSDMHCAHLEEMTLCIRAAGSTRCTDRRPLSPGHGSSIRQAHPHAAAGPDRSEVSVGRIYVVGQWDQSLDPVQGVGGQGRHECFALFLPVGAPPPRDGSTRSDDVEYRSTDPACPAVEPTCPRSS